MSDTSFAALQLPAPFLANLTQLGYHADDAGPGRDPAAGAGRPRPDRAGEDRQRQDRRLRHRHAAQAEPGAVRGAGHGDVPDARAGRPGRERAAAPGARHRQRQDRGAHRRRADAAADRVAGIRRPHRGRHPGPHPRPPGQGHPRPGAPAHPGAGRSRPHDRHGLLRRDRGHRARVPVVPPDPAVLGHLSGRHPPGHRTLPDRSGGSRGRDPPRAGPHRPALLRDRLSTTACKPRRACWPTSARRRRSCSATPRRAAASWPTICANRAGRRARCTARWNSATATRP
jgi:hypothetical protein